MARKPDPATITAASASERSADLAADLAAEPADRLEQLFEARVARALDRLRSRRSPAAAAINPKPGG